MGIEGHKRRKGTKGHVRVNRRGLPLCVGWGPGNEQDSRKLKAWMEGVRLRKRGRKKARNASMKKPIARSEGAWSGSLGGGREGFGGFPEDTSDFFPRFKASSTWPASSWLGEF